MEDGGYLGSENLKLHEIVRFLTEEIERHPNKHSFDSNEILINLFQNELGLPIKLGEVNHLLRTLIEEDDVVDCTTKDNIGTKGVLVTNNTSAAFHGKKYIKQVQDSGSPTFNIQNYQSNEGIIQGDQIIDQSSTSDSKQESNKSNRIIIALMVITIIVMILIAIWT